MKRTGKDIHALGGFCAGVMALLLACLFSSCGDNHRSDESIDSTAIHFDLDSIRKRGKIILLTENSASTYYLYRNQPRGFDYEMARAFARHLGVKLEVRMLDDVDKMFELLNKGEGDLIASNLTVTPKRQQHVLFSEPVYQTRQMLVQRKIYGAASDDVRIAVTDSSQLNVLPIWVHRYSSFFDRLIELESAMQVDLNIQEAPGEISTDDLVRLVNDGELPATVTDENLVTMELLDFPDIDASVPLTGYQNIAWAVRKNSIQLHAELNKWITSAKIQDKLKSTYRKYFGELDNPSIKSYEMPKMGPGSISPYDSLFKLYAGEIGWDWRLLAALSYQESRFNPQAQSWSGAYGLMQLMPETSIRFGCDSTPDPECSIRAGVKYLKYLQGLWRKKVPDPAERNKFVLASYNIGQGHIIDAQNLARELGMADTIWDGQVAEALLLKQQEKYYSMDCVKHGYCRAKEPYHFVGKIYALYSHFSSRP